MRFSKNTKKAKFERSHYSKINLTHYKTSSSGVEGHTLLPEWEDTGFENYERNDQSIDSSDYLVLY